MFFFNFIVKETILITILRSQSVYRGLTMKTNSVHFGWKWDFWTIKSVSVTSLTWKIVLYPFTNYLGLCKHLVFCQVQGSFHAAQTPCLLPSPGKLPCCSNTLPSAKSRVASMLLKHLYSFFSKVFVWIQWVVPPECIMQHFSVLTRRSDRYYKNTCKTITCVQHSETATD